MALQALVFDAYGTLYDVHAVIRRCDEFWPDASVGSLNEVLP